MHYLILHFLVWPFLGLVGEVDPPPVYLPAFWSGCISALDFFVLQGAYSDTLDIHFRWLISRDYCVESLEGPDPLLRVPFGCFVFDVFGGSSEMF